MVSFPNGRCGEAARRCLRELARQLGDPKMTMIMKTFLLIGLFAMTAQSALGQASADAPPPPPMSDDQSGQEEIEPEVVIIQREDKTIEEYRVNGRLYMIKIIPKNAPPYFLLDNDGDGAMETRLGVSDLEPDIMIPRWVLFRW